MPVLTSLGSWVTRLMHDFPWFDEYDLSTMIEEKTGFRIQGSAFEQVRSFYVHSKRRAWSPDVTDEVLT